MTPVYPSPFKLLAIVCSCFLFVYQASAQTDPFPKYADTETATQPFNSEKPYYIIQCKDRLPYGLQILRQFNDRIAIIQLNHQNELNHLKTIADISPADNTWKLSPSIEKSSLNNTTSRDYILTANTFSELQKLLQQLKHVEIIAEDTPSRSLVVRTTRKILLNQILSLKEVIFADIRKEPRAEIAIIGYKRSFHGLSAVDYSIPDANGKNIVAGVKEQAMQALDLDLHKRVISSTLAAPTISNHATVISSIIGGAGNSFYDGRGIAWKCQFFPSSFSNLFADNAATLNANKVTVQNHSYGTIIQQFYGAEAVSYDVQTWDNKNIVHVFSAGNQGTGKATEGPYAGIQGFANLTGNFKMAKNVITAGAIDNKGIIPAESSAGPLYDGRVAPQLVALGPNGTSDAAAVISGTIAVLQQVYADSNNQSLPPASLTKALLYNNADDVLRKNLDYKTGYGLLNSYESILALQQKRYDSGSVSQSQQWTKNITVPPNCASTKVTLAWTDPPALPNNIKALINDLDMDLVAPDGTIYKPWVLNCSPHPDSLVKAAVRKRDSLNTAEQITIDLPAPGIYEVRVTGTSITGAAVPFHIAFNTDTLNTFHFRSPVHTADLNREEDPIADIRWRTFVADTNETGNLYISYDAAHSWQLIRAGQKIHTNNYQWPIKDTSSRAILKMQTSFGDFWSNQFVISKTTKLNIDFLCADSLRLSWNRHIYANNYRLFALTDSPYLKPILTVSDTFVVLDRTLYPYLVYAVQPELVNGIPAARSVAQDITMQGVQCFYRTFYYTLFDENKLDLVLELSAPYYTDSLFFEQIDANGQLLKRVGLLKTNTADFVYHSLVDDLPQGTSYWRVGIRLKSGAIIFTEVVEVLTTGKRYIVFYPNPARKAQPLQYVLKQGVPVDSRLQIFDVTGRMVTDVSELTGNLNSSGLPGGLHVYRLVGNNGQLMETGKLLLLQ